MKKILIDMDGVLADFVEGCCDSHGRSNPYNDPANVGRFDIDKIWGMEAVEFWSKMDYHFWAGLKLMYGAKDIVAMATYYVGPENVMVLSSPCKTKRGECIDGKMSWLERHFPGLRSHFGSEKHFNAGTPNHLLIDDYDKNVNKFIEHGGQCFMVPRPWNTKHQSIGKNWLKELNERLLTWTE